MAQACTQPGCTGEIEDGYCNVCGAPAAAAASAPAQVSGPAAGVGSTRTAGSHGLASSPLGSAMTAGTKSTRKLGTSSTRLRGARLGAGITTVPSEPVVDPSSAIMAVPEVPEERRVCPNCGGPVGRSRAGRPGRTEGFCPTCRSPFSFSPKLQPGDLVGGQYEVAGCLAHGGLGWIYLAKDKNVSDRWVVLKGLLNSGDPDALAAAIAEQQFLARVEHPLIVEIYNFVTHDGAGYIVMEYVGGKSLKAILKTRMKANNGVYDPIPVDQAIAYMVEILPAFQYLHDAELIYCDFKPDNIIQAGDAVKLIDLGGVRRVDDLDSAIYGTVGYQAPEVPEVGTSVPSDIYTIGRTLVSLATEFRGNTSTYVATLPPVADTPLFQRYDSLYRLLLKACAPRPDDRFQSADELRVQLLGVLREVVAADTRGDRPAAHSTASPLFHAPVVQNDTLTWEDLPRLRVDESDPQASWLQSVPADAEERLTALQAAPERTTEVRLATAYSAIAAGRHDIASTTISALLADDPWEWRAVWMSGLASLASGDPVAAQAEFNTVYGQVPGELAPKLALALACELGAQHGVAESLYLTCMRTDANYVAPAAFGLARIRVARSADGIDDDADIVAAVAALDLVPPTSRSFVAARRYRAELLLQRGSGLGALAAALSSIETISLPPREATRLRIDALKAALDDVTTSQPQPQVLIGDVPAEPDALRDGLERAYRDLAGMTDERRERIELVDSANAVRRWTLR